MLPVVSSAQLSSLIVPTVIKLVDIPSTVPHAIVGIILILLLTVPPVPVTSLPVLPALPIMPVEPLALLVILATTLPMDQPAPSVLQSTPIATVATIMLNVPNVSTLTTSMPTILALLNLTVQSLIVNNVQIPMELYVSLAIPTLPLAPIMPAVMHLPAVLPPDKSLMEPLADAKMPSSIMEPHVPHAQVTVSAALMLAPALLAPLLTSSPAMLVWPVPATV